MNSPNTRPTRSVSERHKIKQSVKSFRWLNLLLGLALLVVAYGMFRPTLTIICFFEVCKNLSYLSLWVPRGTYAIQLPILFMCRHLAGSKKIIFIRMSWRRRMKMYFLMDCAWRIVLFMLGVYTCVCAFRLHLISESIYSTRSRIFIRDFKIRDATAVRRDRK